MTFEYFKRSVEKIQVSLKSDKNKGYFHEDLHKLMIIFRSVLLRMGTASDKIVEKIKTHISYPVTLFENRAVYEIM
jgi:hypothetical protein